VALARHRRLDVRRLLLSPVASLGILVAEGYVALSSSRNVGTAFALPWIPSLLTICVAGAATIPSRAARQALACAFAATGLLTMVTKTVDAGIAHRSASVAGYPLVDGASLIWSELADAGYDVGPPGARLPPLHKRWLPFAARLDAAAQPSGNSGGTIAMGTDDSILSGTRLQLAARLYLQRKQRTVSLKPFPDGDTVAAYRQQMLDTGATTLLTGSHPPGSDGFGLTRSVVEAAGRSLGFVPAATMRLPDGRRIVLWRRPAGTRSRTS
jgi:hypothetical protein